MNHDHHDHAMMGHGSSVTPAASVFEDGSTTMHDHNAMTTEGMNHDHMMMMQVCCLSSQPHVQNQLYLTALMPSQMYFEAGYKAVVLFKEWDIQSVGAMVGSCFGVFFLAIIYEGLKYFRYLNIKSRFFFFRFPWRKKNSVE